jgi:hypothetical protein
VTVIPAICRVIFQRSCIPLYIPASPVSEGVRNSVYRESSTDGGDGMSAGGERIGVAQSVL